MFDFPANPAPNDEFTGGNASYVFNGTGWVAQIAAGAPTPIDGYTRAESDGRFVNVTGDIMTGRLELTAPTGDLYVHGVADARIFLESNSAAGTCRIVGSNSTDLTSWELTLGDTSAARTFMLARRNASTGDVVSIPLKIYSNGFVEHGYNISAAGIFVDDKSGQGALVNGRNNAGVLRWVMALGNNTTETGGNAGKQFQIIPMSDTGVNLPIALSIERSNSYTTLYGLYLNGFTDRWINNGQLAISNNGYKPGGGVWADSSDSRIKDVLGDYEHGLAQIKQLNPVRYVFKGNMSLQAPKEGEPLSFAHQNALDRTFIGLVAQDVEPVMPEMVTQVEAYINSAKVNDLRMLDGNALTYALINAVKELAARVETLEAQLGQTQRK